MVKCGVLFEVRTELLNIIKESVDFKGLTNNYLKVPQNYFAEDYIGKYLVFFSVPVCAITASGVPRGTLVSINRFSTQCV
jgi:hypothetical protein